MNMITFWTYFDSQVVVCLLGPRLSGSVGVVVAVLLEFVVVFVVVVVEANLLIMADRGKHTYVYI